MYEYRNILTVSSLSSLEPSKSYRLSKKEIKVAMQAISNTCFLIAQMITNGDTRTKVLSS